MAKKIVYENMGGICIVTPVDPSIPIEQIIEKDVPVGCPYKIIDDSELPNDRSFRNAWIISGGMIAVDMAQAREIHKDKLRVLREPLLKGLDTDFIRAIEAGDVAAQAEIARKKQALRDVTAAPEIEAAATPDELKAAIPPILEEP